MMTTTHAPDSIGKTLEDRIQDAITYARHSCQLDGDQSSSCAVAWDIVEELQAERAHQRQAAAHAKTSLQRYCEAYPDADECRLYEV